MRLQYDFDFRHDKWYSENRGKELAEQACLMDSLDNREGKSELDKKR